MDLSFSKIVTLWLDDLGYLHTNEIQEWLLPHPDYPSLLSLSQTLRQFNINCLAAEINKETLLTLNEAFLANVNLNNKTKIVCARLNEGKNTILLKTEENTKQVIPISHFFNIWSGVVVVSDKSKSKAILNKKNQLLLC